MTPLVWLGILAILLVIEAITVGLTTVWFAGGALIACIASWLGGGIVVQLLLFFGVSVVLLIFTRPLAVRYMNKGVEKTNAESLLGKRAVVIQQINNLAQTGRYGSMISNGLPVRLMIQFRSRQVQLSRSKRSAA